MTAAQGVTSLGANWEVGAFSRAGLLTSSFFSGDNDRGTIRLDTTFRREDPERITSAIAGDTITRAGSYGASVRIGGLQYRRDFATAPLLITYPQADVSGTAVVPSTVDVFIGNAKAYSTQVKPGPFSLQNLPVPVGAGNVRVVTRDVFGKETATVVPYVRYDSMLRQGLHDFSYEAGLLRRDYAIKSNDYGDFAAVGTHRYGVTNWLTIEGHAEAMADRANLGGVVQVTMPVLGLVGIGGAASTARHRHRHERRYRHARQGVLPEERAELERRRRGAAAIAELRRHRLRARADPHARHAPGLGVRAGQRPELAERAGAAHDRPDGHVQHRHARLDVFADAVGHADREPSRASRAASQATNNVFSVFLSMPLGERDYATVSVERRSNPSETNVLLNVSRNLLETDSFGYRVLAGEQSDAKRLELGAFARTGVGEFGVEAADSFGTQATRAYARGGIAAAGGEWRISRYLDQSFAIVKVADFKDVRVYANSQPVGKTDANGVAVIPRLSGFLPNTDHLRGRGHSAGRRLRRECEAGEDREPHGRGGGHGRGAQHLGHAHAGGGERPAGAGRRVGARRRSRGGVSGGAAADAST